MRRRKNGTGSLWLRNDGHWCVSFSQKGHKRKHFYFDTRRDAAAALERFLAGDGVELEERAPVPMRHRVLPSTRFAVLTRDRFCCRYCGARAPEVRLVVDHILPVSQGGSNIPENLVSACELCNAGKGSRLLPGLIEDQEPLPPPDDPIDVADLPELPVLPMVLSLADAAELTGHTKETLRGLIRDGALPECRLGHKIFIPSRALRPWMCRKDHAAAIEGQP